LERHLLWFSLIHSLPPVTTRWLARKTQATHAHNSATYTERAHHTQSHSLTHSLSHTHTHTRTNTTLTRNHPHTHSTLPPVSYTTIFRTRVKAHRLALVPFDIGSPTNCRQNVQGSVARCYPSTPPRSRSPPYAACAACRRERCTTASKNSNRGDPLSPIVGPRSGRRNWRDDPCCRCAERVSGLSHS